MCDRPLPAAGDNPPPPAAACRPAAHEVHAPPAPPHPTGSRPPRPDPARRRGPRFPPVPPRAGRGPPFTLGPMAVQMAPSILSADFARLASEAEAVSGEIGRAHV